MEQFETETENEVACDSCGKTFDSAAKLRGHKMTCRPAVKQRDRKKRVPLGVPRLKMEAPTKEGKVRRWINDSPGRIQAALNGGYEFVEDSSVHVGQDYENKNSDLGARISMVVSRKTGMKAYFMEIDKDLYDEDQREKQKYVDKTDHAIRHGKLENTLGDKGYVDKIEYNP